MCGYIIHTREIRTTVITTTKQRKPVHTDQNMSYLHAGRRTSVCLKGMLFITAVPAVSRHWNPSQCLLLLAWVNFDPIWYNDNISQILHNRYNGLSWCRVTRCKSISSRCIDLVLSEYSSVSTKGVIHQIFASINNGRRELHENQGMIPWRHPCPATDIQCIIYDAILIYAFDFFRAIN